MDRSRRCDALTKKESARELRQGGSDYRCCIPALAGFVSPQSIAPDGGESSSQQTAAQLGERNRPAPSFIACRYRGSALTVRCASVCIERVKWLAFLLLVLVFFAATSCTTLVNRRDLYSPEPAPESLEATRQWYGVTTTSTTTTTTQEQRERSLRRRTFATEVQSISRKEDLTLFSPHLSGRRTLLWPTGVCALRFSSTSDGVVRNAPSRPCHRQ